ncbi:T91 [Tupaiid betaherpesvirus 1]|uniref:T91 n=1 Tax=Tupaiid herpesvirus 1 (strain 1) TaxID=10397 RepID=Q997C3_TUHV1|nr:T91 [Tupaiid betaherpesvirus 1]AAK00705.1 T91 protein [Tupaiid betaherpesvirus 1]AAK57134.1 T91 [Tupaiid betaherpesvirus 1]
MNSLLQELNRAGIAYESAEDIFAYAERVVRSFSFLFPAGESELRQLESAGSLFDQLAIECLHEVTALIATPEGGGAGAPDAGRGGAARDAPSPPPGADERVEAAAPGGEREAAK